MFAIGLVNSIDWRCNLFIEKFIDSSYPDDYNLICNIIAAFHPHGLPKHNISLTRDTSFSTILQTEIHRRKVVRLGANLSIQRGDARTFAHVGVYPFIEIFRGA